MKHKYLIRAYDKRDWLFELDDGTECVRQFTLPVGPYEKNEMSDTVYHRGDNTPYHEHEQGCETFFIVKGSVEVTVRGKRCIASAGDMLHLMPGVPHGFVFLEEGTVWRELFQSINMAQSTLNKNLIKSRYPGLYYEPDFRRRYLGGAKNIERFPPVVTNVPKENLPEIRTPSFALSAFSFDGVELRQKVGRWECGQLKEIWHASLRQGVRIDWDIPYGDWELYYIETGEIRFTILDESFVAGPDTIVHIPPYAVHSLEVLRDACLYDCDCSAKLLSLLEDHAALLASDPDRLSTEEARRDFLHKYGCFVTGFHAG
ncbi:MAG: cupin domain-containing protein [Oscillospiraceae bacterium]|nr:cupin domain-containing protein [Oscillospiraceae bacterium]